MSSEQIPSCIIWDENSPAIWKGHQHPDGMITSYMAAAVTGVIGYTKDRIHGVSAAVDQLKLGPRYSM